MKKIDLETEFQIESVATSDGHARHNFLIDRDQTSRQSKTHIYSGNPDGNLRPWDTPVADNLKTALARYKELAASLEINLTASAYNDIIVAILQESNPPIISRR